MAHETREARKVSLNRATRDELMEIDGIGPDAADTIIRYRENLGRFHAVEDLRSVPGLDLRSFERYKAYLSAS